MNVGCGFCRRRSPAQEEVRCVGCARALGRCTDCEEAGTRRCNGCAAGGNRKRKRSEEKDGREKGDEEDDRDEDGDDEDGDDEDGDDEDDRDARHVPITLGDKAARIDEWNGCGSFGFELEVAALKVFYGAKELLELSKAVLWRDDEAGVSVEIDGDHIEFVTDKVECDCGSHPAEALARLKRQMAFIRDTFQMLCKSDRHTVSIQLDLQTMDGCRAALSENEITEAYILGTAGMQALGTMQATFGVPLCRVGEMLLQNRVTAAVTRQFDGPWREYLNRQPEHVPSDEVVGLFRACHYYILQLAGCKSQVTDKDGLKTVLPFLARTDFASMFSGLSPDDQRFVRAHLLRFFELWARDIDIPMIPGGYLAPDRTEEQGPTIRQWLDSILVPCRPVYRRRRRRASISKDLLSPPDGYCPHTEGQFTYSMGKYGCCHIAGCEHGHQLVLWELRDVASECTIERVGPLAENIACFCLGLERRLEIGRLRHGEPLSSKHEWKEVFDAELVEDEHIVMDARDRIYDLEEVDGTLAGCLTLLCEGDKPVVGARVGLPAAAKKIKRNLVVFHVDGDGRPLRREVFEGNGERSLYLLCDWRGDDPPRYTALRPRE